MPWNSLVLLTWDFGERDQVEELVFGEEHDWEVIRDNFPSFLFSVHLSVSIYVCLQHEGNVIIPRGRSINSHRGRRFEPSRFHLTLKRKTLTLTELLAASMKSEMGQPRINFKQSMCCEQLPQLSNVHEVLLVKYALSPQSRSIVTNNDLPGISWTQLWQLFTLAHKWFT